MRVAENIEHYFAFLERQAHRQDSGATLETLPFVTLSRQAGAGAGEVGQALLRAVEAEPDRRLFDGWRVLDREGIDRLQRKDSHQRVRALVGEDYHNQIGEFVLGLFGREAPQDTALLRQSALLRSLAALGRVIIIGHGASQATRALRAGLHLRLYAPAEARARRFAERSGITSEEAGRRLDELDRARARLLKQHYRVDIDDPLLYDALFNTAAQNAETVAAAIVAMIRQRTAAG